MKNEIKILGKRQRRYIKPRVIYDGTLNTRNNVFRFSLTQKGLGKIGISKEEPHLLFYSYNNKTYVVPVRDEDALTMRFYGGNSLVNSKPLLLDLKEIWNLSEKDDLIKFTLEPTEKKHEGKYNIYQIKPIITE